MSPPTPPPTARSSGRCTWHRCRWSPHRTLPGPAPVDPLAAPAPAADPLAMVNSVDIPAPALDAANQAVTGELPVAPAEVPHLASPQNLPTGTTLDEGDLPAQSPNVGYLKDLWHAIQTQDITGKDALLALTQRPMSTPEPGSENLNAGPGIAPGPVGDVPPAPLGAEVAARAAAWRAGTAACARPAVRPSPPTRRSRRRRTGASTPVAVP